MALFSLSVKPLSASDIVDLHIQTKIALITFLMIIFSEKEKDVEGWPLGLTSCPTPSCDHQ